MGSCVCHVGSRVHRCFFIVLLRTLDCCACARHCDPNIGTSFRLWLNVEGNNGCERDEEFAEQSAPQVDNVGATDGNQRMNGVAEGNPSVTSERTPNTEVERNCHVE